jgi:CubicO group peptidase (beta-lactamase class C family)
MRLALVIALVWPMVARAEPSAIEAERGASIDARVRAYADAGLFSGVVLVAIADRVVYEHAFGLADRELGVPNTPATKFHIASLSKPITAAAILLLAERKRLALSDHVATYVPGVPHGDRITIEELLTHTSGLPDASSTADYGTWSRFPQTPASLVAELAKLPPRDEPGASYSYSNSNYHVLAAIIEKVSGQSYGAFLDANIFRPLRMTSTAHHGDASQIIDGLASGYMPDGATKFAKPPYFDWTAKTGNGSLYSTARDLLAFHRALQHGGLLAPATVKASYGFDNPARRVGMFWFHHVNAGHRSVYVNGSSPGFKAHIERFIDDDACVIVLSNLYVASPSAIADDIASLLWQPQMALPSVPAPVARSKQQLARAAGTYIFGHDFYQPDATVRIEVDGGALAMHYPALTVSLVPIAGGDYFDRDYWSCVRFEPGKLIYRNGTTEFVATRRL